MPMRIRIRPTAAAVLAAALALSVADAQPVRLRLRDGTEVRGELQGYDADANQVLLKTSPDRVEPFPWGSVQEVVPTGEGAALASVPAPRSSPPSAPGAGPEPLPARPPETRPEVRMHFDRGQIQVAASNFPEAEQELREAVSLDPWFVPARFALARLYLDTSRADDAIVTLRKILEIDPRNARAHELMAAAAEAKGWFEKANVERVEALRCTYAGAEADYRIAHRWIEVGNLDRAKAAWEAYRRADPDLREPCCAEGAEIRRGEAALTRGDYPAALHALHAAIQRNPLLRPEAMARIHAARWTLINELVNHRELRRAFEEILYLREEEPHHDENFAFVEALYRHFAAGVLTTGQVGELAEELRQAGGRLPRADYQALLRAVLATLAESRDRRQARPEAALDLCRLLAEMYRADPDLTPALRGQLHDFAVAEFRASLGRDAWAAAMDYAGIAEALAPKRAEIQLAIVQAIGADVRTRLPQTTGPVLQGRIETAKARLARGTALGAQGAIAQALEETAAADPAVLSVLPFVREAFLSEPKAPASALARLAAIHVLVGDRRNAAGDADGAAQAWADAAALDPARRDALLPRIHQTLRARHEKLMAEGKVTAAREVLVRMASLDPKNPALLEELGARDVQIARDGLRGEKDPIQRRRILDTLARNTEQFGYPANVRADVDRLVKAETPAATPAITGGESRWLPLRPNAWYRYARRDGLEEEITVKSRDEEQGRTAYRLEKMTRALNASEQNKAYPVLNEQVTLYQDAQGVYVEEGSDRDVLIRFPVMPGQTWEHRTPGFTLKRRVLSVGAPVVTRRGTFAGCLVIEQTSTWQYEEHGAQNARSRSYYAPNIGLVKVEFDNENQQDRNLELADFKIPVESR